MQEVSKFIPPTVLWNCNGLIALEQSKKTIQNLLIVPTSLEFLSKESWGFSETRQPLIQIDQKDNERPIQENEVMGRFSGKL